MSTITKPPYPCLLCGETYITENKTCNDCQNDAGELLEMFAPQISVFHELLDLAKTFHSSCAVRLSLIQEERDEAKEYAEDNDLSDFDDQIGHWTALKEKCESVLSKIAL